MWPTVLIGAVVGIGLWIGVRRYLRYRRRHCPECGLELELLSETADDEHLTDTQKTEEQLGSVDYDIWSCPNCEYTLQLRYRAFFTRYSACPKCKARTKSSSTAILQDATEAMSGRKEITETCVNCSYRKVYTRIIPRRSSD